MNFDWIKKFLKEEKGQTSMELIMILGLVVGVTVTVFVFIKGFTAEEVGGKVGEKLACGDSVCDAAIGETTATCPTDCT